MPTIRRIDPVFVERVWGRTDLSPLYGPQNQRVGEVWFPLGESYPLLVKFLFTSERLSIQVHPRDEYAALHHNGSRGKTEMWYILAADPGASIALGLRRPVERVELEAAIADGSVIQLMEWVPVKAGDTLFAPAGTIHAIGHGVSLCEIQQNSDVTYRLYDYGRPRELHLEHGLAVSDLERYEGRREFPVACDHFTTELLEYTGATLASNIACDHLLIPVSGSGTFNGEPFQAGECWHVPAESGDVQIAWIPGTRVLRARA